MEPWLIGMQLALLGCFSSAVGLVLLKHSTNVEGNLPLVRTIVGEVGHANLTDHHGQAALHVAALEGNVAG